MGHLDNSILVTEDGSRYKLISIDHLPSGSPQTKSAEDPELSEVIKYDDQKFGAYLKKLITLCNTNQGELGKSLGISQSLISKICKGERHATEDRRRQLLNGLKNL